MSKPEKKTVLTWKSKRINSDFILKHQARCYQLLFLTVEFSREKNLSLDSKTNNNSAPFAKKIG